MKQVKRKPGRPKKTTTTEPTLPNDWSTVVNTTKDDEIDCTDATEMNFVIVSAIAHSPLTATKKLALINIVNASFNS